MLDCPTQQDIKLISQLMDILKPVLPKKRKLEGFKWEAIPQKKEEKNVED